MTVWKGLAVCCLLSVAAGQYGPPKQTGPVKHRTTTTTQTPPSVNDIFPESGDSVYQPPQGYQPQAQQGQPPSPLAGYQPSYSYQPGQQPAPGYPAGQPGAPPPPGSSPVKPVDISKNPFLNGGISGKPVSSGSYQPQPGYPNQGQQPQPGYPNQGQQPQPGYPNQGQQPQPGYPNQGQQPQPGYPNQGQQPQPGYPNQGQPNVPNKPINIQGNPFLSGAVKPQQPAGGYPSQQPGAQPPPFKPQQPYQPDQSAYKPGQVNPPSYQPGRPGVPQHQPGQQPGQQPYQPGQQPGQPGQQPGQPGQQPYQPGQQPYQPGQQPYQPGQQPGQPGQQPYQPGQQQPYQPGQQPGAPACSRPGSYCVPPSSCAGGVITGKNSYKTGSCSLGEICCAAPPQPSPYTPAFVTEGPATKYTGPLNTAPPQECAAALKCVPESYCDEKGVMRDGPVALTREQQENKVALSDCQNLETGVVGKCCRDPNYKDPWPAGMMIPKINDLSGQYNPSVAGFDDGQYKPGQYPGETGQPGTPQVNNYGPDQRPYQPAPTVPTNPYTIKKPLGVFGMEVTPFPVAPRPGQTHGDVFPNNEDKLPIPAYPQTAGPQAHPVPAPNQSPGVSPSGPTSPYGPGITPGQPLIPGNQQGPGCCGGEPSSGPQPDFLFPGQIPNQPSVLSSAGPGPAGLPGSYRPPLATGPLGPSGPYEPQGSIQPSGPVSAGPYEPQGSIQPSGPVSAGPYEPQGSTQPAGPTGPQGPVGPYGAPGSIQPSGPSGTYGASGPVAPQSPSNPQTPGYEQPSLPQPSAPESPITPGEQCGVRRPSQTTKPDEAGFGEFPWHAIVQSAKNRSSICSGVIIAPNAVLTAAHCIASIKPNDLIVRVGEWTLGRPAPKPAQARDVTAHAVHPMYNAGALRKDQAIVITASPFRFDQHIDKICLPSFSSSDYISNTGTCYLTGYGRNNLQNNSPGSVLHKIPITIIPKNQCENSLKQTHLGKYFQLNSGFTCAAPVSQSELCKIDVGSPLVCDRGDGRYELAGVYSWDTQCSSTLPGVVASADTDWINKVLTTPVDTLRENQRQPFVDLLEPEDIEQKPGFALGYGR